MTVEQGPIAKVGHRDHFLRPVQYIFEPAIPSILVGMYHAGLLEHTEVATKLLNSKPVSADDVTISQLQKTVAATDELLVRGPSMKATVDWNIAWLLDGLDGGLARLRHTASADGATRDALADRLGELRAAQEIANALQKYGYDSHKIQYNFRLAIPFSTVSKTLCEMTGVHTSEGGQGSMMERRKILFTILSDLGKLNNCPDPSLQQELLDKIDFTYQFLINSSFARATTRVNTIQDAILLNHASWDNPELDNSNSSASIEARKFVSVVSMLSGLGTDMMSALHTLNDEVDFPSVDSLIKKYPYISDSMKNNDGFLHQALSIAGFTPNT